jgi:transcriptional regulator with XRE-family HTH domain
MTQNIAFPVIDMRATGENIRKLREQNGMKVRDLQEIFGFTSPMSIYKWQEGKTLPDYTNLLLLTDLWNVKVEDILVRENRDIFSFSSVSENENPSQIILLKSTSRTNPFWKHIKISTRSKRFFSRTPRISSGVSWCTIMK